MNKGKWILKCLLGGIFFLLLVGLATMLLWNWLLPAIFEVPQITFLQALGLLLLARLLVGHWGGRCKSGGRLSWKERYHEKLSGMTPEERERFKIRMKEKWRCGPSHQKDEFAAGSND